jgi:hypothetical protein
VNLTDKISLDAVFKIVTFAHTVDSWTEHFCGIVMK